MKHPRLLPLRVTLLVVSLVLFALSGCQCEDREGAERALTGMGFTEIQLFKPNYFTNCGQGDAASNRFQAKNPAGVVVTGEVCCGGPLATKGCTVRF